MDGTSPIPGYKGVTGAYLQGIYQEALKRGYWFSAEKIMRADFPGQILCTRGQLLYEWKHLREKLKQRDVRHYAKIKSLQEPEPHPLFSIVAGDVEAWEIRGATR